MVLEKRNVVNRRPPENHHSHKLGTDNVGHGDTGRFPSCDSTPEFMVSLAPHSLLVFFPLEGHKSLTLAFFTATANAYSFTCVAPPQQACCQSGFINLN